MDGDRCSRCAAALPVGAPWCTLCFAAVPESPPAAEPATSVLALVAAAATDVAPAGLPTDVADHGALPAGAPEKAPRWPCQSCGGTVPLAEPRCPACGAAFLAGADRGPTLSLPGIGDLLARSRGQRLLIGAGVSVLLLTVLLAIMWLLGSLL